MLGCSDGAKTGCKIFGQGGCLPFALLYGAEIRLRQVCVGIRPRLSVRYRFFKIDVAQSGPCAFRCVALLSP